MPRKGWSAVQVPDRWLQVDQVSEMKIRTVAITVCAFACSRPGCKPPACGRWKSGDPAHRREEQSYTTVLDRALGPKDGGVREQVSKQHNDVQHGKGQICHAVVPEVTVEAARVSVVKLEAARAALAQSPGPEVDVFDGSIGTCQGCRVPCHQWTSTFTQCQQFIGRPVKRSTILRGGVGVCRRFGTCCNICNRKPQRV